MKKSLKTVQSSQSYYRNCIDISEAPLDSNILLALEKPHLKVHLRKSATRLITERATEKKNVGEAPDQVAASLRPLIHASVLPLYMYSSPLSYGENY
jgi:hypothetical protein